jgi:hypothetical protein
MRIMKIMKIMKDIKEILGRIDFKNLVRDAGIALFFFGVAEENPVVATVGLAGAASFILTSMIKPRRMKEPSVGMVQLSDPLMTSEIKFNDDLGRTDQDLRRAQSLLQVEGEIEVAVRKSVERHFGLNTGSSTIFLLRSFRMLVIIYSGVVNWLPSSGGNDRILFSVMLGSWAEAFFSELCERIIENEIKKSPRGTCIYNDSKLPLMHPHVRSFFSSAVPFVPTVIATVNAMVGQKTSVLLMAVGICQTTVAVVADVAPMCSRL